MIPYTAARSGEKAKIEITKILKEFGASEVGFLENYEKGTLSLGFRYHGMTVQMEASAKGWGTMYLKQNPWNHYRRMGKEEYGKKWLDQGFIAVNSILRDWIKGQMTALEIGVLTFEGIFMPYMLTADGTPLFEKAMPLLLGATENSERTT